MSQQHNFAPESEEKDIILILEKKIIQASENAPI